MTPIKQSRRWKMSGMYLKGLIYEKIGQLFGVSRQRAHQIIMGYHPNPTEVYRQYLKKACEKCGATKDKARKGGTLSVHHIDGNHKNNNPENLMTVCTQCHAEIHAPEKYGIKHTHGFKAYQEQKRKKGYEYKYGKGTYQQMRIYRSVDKSLASSF